MQSPNVPGSASDFLDGITVVSSTDIWAVGNYNMSDTGNAQPLAEHYDGTNWTVVSTPSTNLGGVLNGVTAISSSDIWAVGLSIVSGSSNQTLTEHFDGTSWSIVASPNAGSAYNFLNAVAAVSTDDVWVVGNLGLYGLSSNPAQTLIEHYMVAHIVNVTVSTPGGHFISSYIQDNAALPLHIHVSYSDGSPVVGASVRLSNPNGFLAVFNPITDSNGNLDAPLPLPPSLLSPQSLTAGDFTSEVIATVNGKDYSSGSLTLYHADLLGSLTPPPLTQSEADNYSSNLLQHYLTRPGIPCSSGLVICYSLRILDSLAKVALANKTYSPKAGDSWTVQVYKYSAPTMTPVYLYYESANRNGGNIYNYARWTEDITQVQPWLNQQSIVRTALVTKFASPVTALAINSTGQRAGFDPSINNYVFDFPAAISNAGDEPYELLIPSPVQGQYTYQVTGTGNGTYTMTVQSLDSGGNGNPITTISGVAAPGITDTYVLTYPTSTGQPVIVVRKIAIDIKPGEDPPAINPTSTGVIPVAILSTPTFDARNVSLSSVRFGPASARPVDRKLDIEDVNRDGLPDVVFHFVINQTGIKAGNTQACLSGQTTSSANVTGCDSIRTVTSGS